MSGFEINCKNHYSLYMCPSKCVFCSSSNINSFFVKETGYFLCKDCGGIFVNPESRLSLEKQKERYLKHNNTISNKGYVDFLESFIKPVLSFISSSDGKGGSIKQILDYGSGPEPVLVELLEKYKKDGILDETCEIRGWDPFFAPDVQFFEGGSDLVTCLEVAEHFETPQEDLEKLASCVKDGGFVAIGTMLLPSGGIDAFKKWWYRSDATHVSFYTEKAIREVAAKNGLVWVTNLNDRTFLFKKEKK